MLVVIIKMFSINLAVSYDAQIRNGFQVLRWISVGSVGLNSGLQTCKASEPSLQPSYGFSCGITMKRGHKCETQGYRGVTAAAGGS